MIPAVNCISRLIGVGNSAAPAATASSPCCCSSSRICLTIARLRESSCGRPSRCESRCAQTWRSVSAMKPRLHLSPRMPLAAPIANAPAYHTGLKRLGVLAQLVNPLLAPGEMIELFIRRLLHLVLDIGVPRHSGVTLVKGLGSNLTGMIHTHQAGRM